MNLIARQLNVFTSPVTLAVTAVICAEQMCYAYPHQGAGGSNDAINEKNKS